jgi:hypothetical protein
MDHWRFMICIEIVIMIYMKSLFSPEKPIVKLKVYGGSGPILQAYSRNEHAMIGLN